MLVDPLDGRTIGGPDGAFVVGDWRDDVESSREEPIAPLHVHYSDDEAWYVLEGTLGFRLGDEEIEARPGAAVFVPRGTPHTYWNARREPARYLIVMTQTTWRLVEEVHSIEERTPETMSALFRKYDSELL
jgi:mannose-6-phosphate isomerase-like protein (cupin superfamily)